MPRTFGPKQARNLLQGLGLTKHEIPLDSRIANWLKEFGFAVENPESAFLTPRSYERILDSIHELCRRCDVLPCILDAAIFASSDGDGWDEATMMIW